MKIAVVASSPIPYGAGGAEKLWWGLVDNINRYTNHQCELIKIPIVENTFDSLLAAYEHFSKVDLSHFDMVITGKYPAWMIDHPNHHIYLLHCLRGLYDTYPASFSTTVVCENLEINEFIAKLDGQLLNVEAVFSELKRFEKLGLLTEELKQFPGPFIRKVIHYLDEVALSKTRRISAISQTVADRSEYFPNFSHVDVVYPPSTMSGFHNEASQYFFTASRLDGPKRIAMIVKAYMKTDVKIPLIVAGMGPLLDELKELAKDDTRITFVGYVSDLELIELYAKALAIIFVPEDEDYGLITVEAMKSAKPVITVSDSGGVTEFVRHQETGLMSEPNEQSLADNITWMAEHPEHAAAMGENAKQFVEDINWPSAVSNLIEQGQVSSTRRKITIVSTYAFYPPQGGGQNRTYYLYKELARQYDVDVICLAHESETLVREEVAPHLMQIKVPKSQTHALNEWKIEEQAGIPVTDIAFQSLYDDTPQLKVEFETSIKDAHLVICNHSYVYPFVKKYSPLPVTYDCHNIEFELKRQMLSDSSFNNALVEQVKMVEKELCEVALRVAVCSEEDGHTLSELFSFDENKVFVAANGVDTNSVKYIAPESRRNIRERLGLKNEKVALFIGSWHQPNIEAVEEIVKLAKSHQNIHFIVIGSVGGYFKNMKTPDNIAFPGLVSDSEKQSYLNIADFALNLMFTGSGTNLKMLDYILSGLPVISTEVGKRGLGLSQLMAIGYNNADFASNVIDVNNIDTLKAARYVKDNFDWRIVGEQYITQLADIS